MESDNESTYYQTPNNPHNGSIVYMTDPQKEIKKLKLSLMNAYIDDKGDIIHYGDPLLNNDGIAKIIGFVNSIVNTSSNMTNLDEDKIEKIMMFNSNIIIENLMVNRITWGIKGHDARDLILAKVTNLMNITLNRSLDEGERRFWKGTQQEIHTKIENTNQKTGLLNGIMGLKRGN